MVKTSNRGRRVASRRLAQITDYFSPMGPTSANSPVVEERSRRSPRTSTLSPSLLESTAVQRKVGDGDREDEDVVVQHAILRPLSTGDDQSAVAGVLSKPQERFATNTQRAWGDPSFYSSRSKLQEIFGAYAEHKELPEPENMVSILRGVCAEYTDSKLDMLAALMQHQPTDEQLSAVGIYRITDQTRLDGAVNYVAVYGFTDALRMCDAMRDTMDVRASTVGAFRAKVMRHDWEGKGQLRLCMSGEGTLTSARKYTWWVENPPSVKRATDGRQTNGGVSSDGFFFNLPAAASLVGERCLSTIKVETFVVRTGDQNRASREIHEATIALGLMGGLVFDRASFSLNQKVGGSFTDEQRRKGAIGCSAAGCSCPAPDYKCDCLQRGHKHIKHSTVKANTWYEKDGKMVAPGTEGAVKRATGGASKKGANSIKKQRMNPRKFQEDRSGADGLSDKTLYGREKGDDGRSLSSEQGASMRPTDTSAQWLGHAVEEPDNAEPASCSNCGKLRELSCFFYGGGERRVVALDHMVGKHRCNKYPNKPRGVFKPDNEKVKTITKGGLLKAVEREARKGSNEASGGN